MTFATLVAALLLFHVCIAQSSESIVDVLSGLEDSDINSDSPFNKNESDFNILSTLILLANLDSVFDYSSRFTLFAPNDGAFIQTAKDLGIGASDEETVVENFFLLLSKRYDNPVSGLQDLLLYHIVPHKLKFPVYPTTDSEAADFDEALRLRGIIRDDRTLIDANPHFPDPKTVSGFVNIEAPNSYVHVIDRVLLTDSFEPNDSLESNEKDSHVLPTQTPFAEVDEEKEVFGEIETTPEEALSSTANEAGPAYISPDVELQDILSGSPIIDGNLSPPGQEYLGQDKPLDFEEVAASDTPVASSADMAATTLEAMPTVTASPEMVSTSPLEVHTKSPEAVSSSPETMPTSPAALSPTSENTPTSPETESSNSEPVSSIPPTVSSNPETRPTSPATLTPSPQTTAPNTLPVSSESLPSKSTGPSRPSSGAPPLSTLEDGIELDLAEQLPIATIEISTNDEFASNFPQEAAWSIEASPEDVVEEKVQPTNEMEFSETQSEQSGKMPLPTPPGFSPTANDVFTFTATPVAPVPLPVTFPALDGPSFDPEVQPDGIYMPVQTGDVDWEEMSSSPDPDVEDKACFSSSQIVHLENGSDISLSHLDAGHNIRTSETELSRVYLFTHKMRTGTFDFVHITTYGNHTITMTQGHYIYANGKLRAAGSVEVGDMLRTLDGPARVQSVSAVRGNGLFAPHTLQGDIVVNRIIASTYTTAMHPTLAHMMLWPFRAVTRLGITKEPLGQTLYNGIPGFFAEYRHRASITEYTE